MVGKPSVPPTFAEVQELSRVGNLHMMAMSRRSAWSVRGKKFDSATEANLLRGSLIVSTVGEALGCVLPAEGGQECSAR